MSFDHMQSMTSAKAESRHSIIYPKVRALLLTWLAVSMLIMVSACGKKTGRPTERGPEMQPPINSPQTNDQTNEVTEDETENDEEEANNGEVVNEEQTSPDRDTSTVGGTQPGTTPGTTPGQQDTTRHTPERPTGQVVDRDSIPKPTASGSGPKIVDYNPSGKYPSEIYNDPTIVNPNPALDASLRGASIGTDSSGQPLFYSGSGQDRLYENIKSYVDAEPDDMQRTENQKFATELGFTTFEVNVVQRTAVITVNLINEFGQTSSYRMPGRLDNQLRVRAGNRSVAPFIEAEATCMDLRGGCTTAHIRIAQSSQYGTRTAHVLTRHTQAALYSEGNAENLSRNAEYDRFVHILTTSVHFPGGANSIEALNLTTSEVINGSSEFAATMSMRMSVVDAERAQTLSFYGPLVKPLYESQLLFPVKFRSGYSVYGRQGPVRVSQPISASIRDAALIRNDGRGNLQIDVTFRKSTAAAREDTVRLTFGRLHEITKPFQQH